jgi:hypothetical protein
MRVCLLILLLLAANGVFAQKFEYDVTFHGLGDNREFQSQVANSQTILGERTSFAVGTTLDENHQIRVGLSHLFEFGSNIEEQKPILTAYYHYANDEQKEFYFGSFPRMDLIDFPLALITDTLLYYRPNIQGFYGRYNWDWGHQNGFVDWTSRQTDTRRETFMAGFSGEIRHANFFFQNYITLFHFAGTAIHGAESRVSDDLGMIFFVGSDLDQLLSLQKSYVRAGIFSSKYRERGLTDGYVDSNSFMAQLYGESKYFALRSTLNVGDGHNIMNGDRFYDVDSYWRTDVIWKFINSRYVEGRFNLSFHLVDGGTLDQSQQLAIIYKFGN